MALWWCSTGLPLSYPHILIFYCVFACVWLIDEIISIILSLISLSLPHHIHLLHFNSEPYFSFFFFHTFFLLLHRIFNHSFHDSCQHQHPSFLAITSHHPILLIFNLFTVFASFYSRRAVTHPKAPPHPQYHRAAIVLGKYLQTWTFHAKYLLSAF